MSPEQATEKRTELLDLILQKISVQLDHKLIQRLKRELLDLMEEYDLTHYEVEEYFQEQTGRYEYQVVLIEPEACKRLLSANGDLDVSLAVDSLVDIHTVEPRLFYEVVGKLFKIPRNKLLLFEFYDLTLLYATYRTNKYNRAYILSQPYFREVDEAIEEYFQATFDDVQYAFLKLDNVLDYADEVLIQQVDFALEEGNYAKAFVPLAKALGISKGIYAVKKKSEIQFVRRLSL